MNADKPIIGISNDGEEVIIVLKAEDGIATTMSIAPNEAILLATAILINAQIAALGEEKAGKVIPKVE